MKLKIKKLRPNAVLPCYAHSGDSGMDLCAVDAALMEPGGRVLVKTGLAIELPPGTEAQIRPRSGLASRHGITVVNAPGTVDEGYRGEICVALINLGNATFSIENGMRIAQMVICPVIRVEIEETEVLGETIRDAGGFGSTGV